MAITAFASDRTTPKSLPDLRLLDGFAKWCLKTEDRQNCVDAGETGDWPWHGVYCFPFRVHGTQRTPYSGRRKWF